MYNMKEARIVTCPTKVWDIWDVLTMRQKPWQPWDTATTIQTTYCHLSQSEIGMPHPQNSHGPFDETIGQQVELLQKADNSSALVLSYFAHKILECFRRMIVKSAPKSAGLKTIPAQRFLTQRRIIRSTRRIRNKRMIRKRVAFLSQAEVGRSVSSHGSYQFPRVYQSIRDIKRSPRIVARSDPKRLPKCLRSYGPFLSALNHHYGRHPSCFLTGARLLNDANGLNSPSNGWPQDVWTTYLAKPSAKQNIG